MPSISGVPTTRITDLFVRQRLLQQMQEDQREIVKLQLQLSTGQRFSVPSEQPITSLRVIGLQRLLEQKEQVAANLATTQSYLTAADTALSSISGMVSEVRATALGVLGTTATDTQRQAAVLQIQQTIQQLLDAGNQKFRGRYLFAGSMTEVRPFAITGNNLVTFYGNEQSLFSYVDTDLLSENNVLGSRVFGAISTAVQGMADLQPRLRFDTPLADLNHGAGVDLGSIVISDGNKSAVVDLSSAHTIGDVAMLIRRNSARIPVNVEVTAQGLKIQLNASAGDLSIRDVGNGTTARQLGIYRDVGVGTSPIVGSPLNPALKPTTRLADLFGSPARAVLRFQGGDNDFYIEADRNGEALNGVKIRLIDDPSIAAGEEVVEYDAGAKEISIRIDETHTQARDVVAAINSAYAAGKLPFFAYLDPTDQEMYSGQGLVFPTPPGEWAAVTAAGTGEDFDKSSGLIITNGGRTFTVDLSAAGTVEDVLNTLNDSQYGLIAEINESTRRINVRSRISGADFAIGENRGTTATQLGLRTLTGETRLDQLNFGRGVTDYQEEGTTARAVYDPVGTHNRLVLQARQAGPQFNDYRLYFYDTGGPPGSELITYDPVNKQIAIGIVPGTTTAKNIVELFAATPGARDHFQLRLDNESLDNDGSGLLEVGEVITSGGSSGGADFTITRADGVVLEIDISGAITIQDVIDRINNHPDNPPRVPGGSPYLIARLAEFGNGIELIDESSGSGILTVKRTQSSTAAIELGLIPVGSDEATATNPGTFGQASVQSAGANNDLIFRTKSPTALANGYRIIFADSGGRPESFTFDPANKVMRFAIHPGVTTANRIMELFSADTVAPRMFDVFLDPSDGNDGSGFVELTSVGDPPEIAGGQSSRLTGRDVNPLETEGIFTALIRLKDALLSNDVWRAQHAIDLLDQAVLNLNFERAELGAKQQSLDILNTRLEDEDLQLKSALAADFDADLAEVISSLVARQSAYQAALQATAQIFRMSLLDYL
ncbi:MAG: flagellin N-terminal helical domain-containing protein [Thermogutta sp.]